MERGTEWERGRGMSIRFHSFRIVVLLIAACVAVLGSGCAHAKRRSGPVAVESRPTPRPPDAQSKPVRAELSPATRRTLIERVVRDTSAAHAAVQRCASYKLLAEQESVLDATRDLLAQVRAALARDELQRAESMARQARLLTNSLACQ
jgi:hypothetical protein